MATLASEALRQRRELHHEADVVVVGAGVLGCALAFALAEQGRSVLLLERWMHEPDRIVGELMQPGGVTALQQLGLAECLEGIDAVPCYGYHVLYDGEEVAIPYPMLDEKGQLVQAVTNTSSSVIKSKKTDDATTYTVPEGCSFHHGRFIMQLRRRCLAHRNITVVETEVTGLVKGQQCPDEVLGVQSRTAIRSASKSSDVPPPKRDDYYFGQLTVIADGYASRFRSEIIGTAPEVKSKFYALELIDCPLEPQGFGHVFINSAAFPVLLYQIGEHETRALIDVPLNLPAAAPSVGGVRGYIRNVVIPSLPSNVRPSVEAALADGKIPRSMPNSYLPPAPQSAITKAAGNGVMLIGDAYNMRHPLTGGGMTVALNDAVVLSGLLHPDKVPSLGDHKAVAAAMSDFHWMRKKLTSIINVLAMALYALFAADNRQQTVLRRGCFQYFQRGLAAQPMALLGGVIHRPMALAYHFFSVAFLAIWIHSVDLVHVRSNSGPAELVMGALRVPLAIADGILVLYQACIVFLPVVFRESW